MGHCECWFRLRTSGSVGLRRMRTDVLRGWKTRESNGGRWTPGVPNTRLSDILTTMMVFTRDYISHEPSSQLVTITTLRIPESQNDLKSEI